MAYKKYPLFSNGTEFMLWQNRNCEQCVKAVFYDEKKDSYPKYRCAIQRDIEEACIGDGTGRQRVWEATHAVFCPQLKTERTARKNKLNDKSLTLDFEYEKNNTMD